MASPTHNPSGPVLPWFTLPCAESNAVGGGEGSGSAGQPSAGAAAGAAGVVQHHQSPRHSLWARAQRLITLDSLFDSLDELFELGDNLDLTVGAGA